MDTLGPILISPVSGTSCPNIILNKTDLVSRESAAATLHWLAGIVPGARIVPAQNASIPPDVVMGHNPRPRFREGHHTVFHTHDTGEYDTLSLEIDGVRDVDRLASALVDPSLGLLRAKGFVRGLDGAFAAVHIVGRRALVEPAPSWIDGPGRLVCIGLAAEMDRAATLAAIKS